MHEAIEVEKGRDCPSLATRDRGKGGNAGHHQRYGNAREGEAGGLGETGGEVKRRTNYQEVDEHQRQGQLVR